MCIRDSPGDDPPTTPGPEADHRPVARRRRLSKMGAGKKAAGSNANDLKPTLQMGLSEIAGPVVLLLVVSTLTLIATLVNIRRRKAAAALHHAIDTNHDGHLSKSELQTFAERSLRIVSRRRVLPPSSTSRRGHVQHATSTAPPSVTWTPCEDVK